MADFPVALRLTGERVVVLGGDGEAANKVVRLANIDADVVVIAEEIDARIRELVDVSRVRWLARHHCDEDLAGSRFVIFAYRDEDEAKRLRMLAHGHGALFSALDDPQNSDVSHVAVIASGPIQIAIMSGGGAPSMIRRMRELMEGAFDERFARFATAVVQKRAEIRALPRGEQKAQIEGWLRGFSVKVALHFPPWFEQSDKEKP